MTARDARLADDLWFTRWRNAELTRLVSRGATYLDYTGAAPYPESLVQRDAERLTTTLLGNPHSESIPSMQSTVDLDGAREAILAYLNASADEYAVILTGNATAACRIVGESFRFGRTAPLVLSQDNHNSINGIREFATRGGASVATVALDHDLRLKNAAATLQAQRGTATGLFAFPAQSNFSGVRHPLALIGMAQSLGYRVLLDAAAFVPTAVLDLSIVHPDFVTFSLYKIAGYPSGIGALVARREALDELERPWFSGGTVDWVTTGSARHQLRGAPDRFEDGTPPFLAAGAVRAALAGVIYADRERLSRHLAALTNGFVEGATSLRHANESPLVSVHGPLDGADRGATIAFTLHDGHGTPIPFWDVERDAREWGIAVRGGCFCNPGCAEEAFGLRHADGCLDTLGGDFSIPELVRCLGGRSVGAVRVSMGLGSVHADVTRVLQFLAAYRH